MYIKKIIIQGFKTYKNHTIIDLVSPHHNVVVGRNGSGKSNFFAAIRFVLSDAYTHMTREERQGLIHEGSGTVMSAYVEIIFDNSDGRIPINKVEVSIRRTIGLKKDDYSLDGRSATRSDVMNLLESAGFSRSNPYYIVPQGKITSLTNSKNGERLLLLKEVSGATVFENKLKESIKEMNNSNYKKQRIDETLQSIDERLSDLQIESIDLKKFQQLEKSKKILEYNLFDREYNELNQTIEDIDENYNTLLQQSSQDLQDLEKREKLCQQLQSTIDQLKVSLKISRLEKDQTNLDYNELFKLISAKEVKIHELKHSNEDSIERLNSIQQQINKFKSLKYDNELKVKDIKPEIINLQNQELKLKDNLSEFKSKQRSLYSKQQRFSKFETKKQRDTLLNQEISLIKRQLISKDNEINQINSQIKINENNISELNKKITNLNSNINNEEYQLTSLNLKNSINELKLELNNLNDKRKILWRDEIRYKSIYDSLNNDLNNANNLVSQTMDRSQAQGLNSVKQIVNKLNLQDKVYGPLAELFNVNEKYKTATEVIAGTSLFHIVVDNDQTASLIMEELVRIKGGRATFMPINRLNNGNGNGNDNDHDIIYPDSNEYQCIPLIKKIKFDNPLIGRAINQVFGKAIVVADLSIGSELARKFKLSAITLDGDRADTRGVLSGGYRDYKRSRLDALKVQSKKRKELTNVENDLNGCVKEIELLNQSITSVNNELQLNVRDLDKLQSQQEPIKIELARANDKKFNLQQELKGYQSNINNLKSIRNSLSINLKQNEVELNSQFAQVLSDNEIEQLNQLNLNIKITENELDSIVTKLSDLETQISSYESELNNNIIPKLTSLTVELNKYQTNSQVNFEVKEHEQELINLNNELSKVQGRQKKVLEEFNAINEEIQKSESSLKKSNDQQLSLLKKLEKFSKYSEKTLNKKSILVNRRDEVQKKIRELGVLPEEAFHTNDSSNDDLLKELNKVNEELLNYSHINKKAMEQFSTFNKQRDELVIRREELETSRQSIEDLIKNLENQKDEAIRKSFKQVAKSFNEIFETLVPAGVGNLIIQKRNSIDNGNGNGNGNGNDGNGDDDVQSEQIEQDNEDGVNEITQSQLTNEQSIDNYVGVAISVSFNSKHDEQQRIEQLSGGQKSLCAIALILAIQQCDPAPFYLFDEIDANLDTQYRTSVANMIKHLSKDAQFICTTFRPEMLQVADKFFGVIYSNKVSSVSEINKEEAMSFVENQQQN
ncbi:RecF/RecN/SMC [Scheffersomyces amazonensis]|uniref:RecF/RecN/SMC n=1 Tax=Scheffersomyces amazonensis TaxID=1078765 RepID=UPI00315D5388